MSKKSAAAPATMGEGYTWCPECQAAYEGEVCPGCAGLSGAGADAVSPPEEREGCGPCSVCQAETTYSGEHNGDYPVWLCPEHGGERPKVPAGEEGDPGADLTTLAEVAEPALKNLNDLQEAVKTAELNVKTRNTTESLKCILTDDEIRRYGIAQARANAEIATAEEELQSVKSQYKSRVDAATATRNDMAKRINNGYEFRQVDCVERWDYVSNDITVRRTDTYEVVSRRTMSRDEMQRKLF